MNKNYYNPNKDGIKIRSINLCMVILCFVLCAGVFVSAFQLKSKYNDIIKNMDEYTRCTKAVNDFRDTSDFLTNQVRLFLIQQDESYATSYFNECFNEKHREKAVSEISGFHEGDSVQVNMMLAYQESKDLAETEMYSIALLYTALNIPEKMFPAEIKDIKLSAEDLALTETQKLIRIENLLFGIDYQTSKDKINRYTTTVLDSVLSQYVNVQNRDKTRFYRFLVVQCRTGSLSF